MPKIDPTEARKAIDAEEKARTKKAMDEIQEICKKYGVELIPVTTLRKGQIFHHIDLVPIEPSGNMLGG